jgi:predicted Zn-dependent protease with MMP-like domain
VLDVPHWRFERLVAAALDLLPDELAAAMDNVVIRVDDQHPDEPELLGLYEGIPLPERGVYDFAVPDVITIYRLPTLRACVTEDDVVEEVRVTVLHEVAHHFGIDDARLDELGWS